MFETIDAVLLARIQFAFTVAFHILFPAFTIGLASWLAVVEWRWLKTGNVLYREIYRQWVKIFAVTFGMGVVSGVVLSYQFGTNWSAFSDKVGNVLGPLLGFEVLTAFFLEASFLGIMLFGWGRVGPKMHFAATVIVATGTLISAFWILSANSWMQTPAGYRLGDDGLFYPTDWIEVIFNPSFPYRFAHMTIAAYLTTAFVVGGIGAYYLMRKQFASHARIITYLMPMPVLSFGLFILLWRDLHHSNEYRPFFATIGIFLMNYIGLGISMWPWLVPFQISFRQAAAAAESQSLLLVGTVILLPMVLAYTAYCYYVFRGKSAHDAHY